MKKTLRWNSSNLEAMPDNGKLYEIVDGELYVSKQPHWQHQFVCGRVFALLDAWSSQTDAGIANIAPGLIFGEEDDVAPDIIWISQAKLATALETDGKLHKAPELVVEVLSPGSTNAHRDREAKLKLYSRHGVEEYWIVNWQDQELEVYRREDAILVLVKTLHQNDWLQSPLLPGFTCKVDRLFTHK